MFKSNNTPIRVYWLDRVLIRMFTHLFNQNVAHMYNMNIHKPTYTPSHSSQS